MHVQGCTVAVGRVHTKVAGKRGPEPRITRSALFLVAAAACCSRCIWAAPRTNGPPAPTAAPPGPSPARPRRCCASLAIAWAVSVVLLREL